MQYENMIGLIGTLKQIEKIDEVSSGVYSITRARDYSNHSRICSSVRSCKDSWNTYKYRRGDKRSYNGCAGRNTSYGST